MAVDDSFLSGQPVRRLVTRWWPDRGVIETMVSQVRQRPSGMRKKRAPIVEVDRLLMERRATESARRARREVYWKCLTIGADHLGTLTYRENMQDLGRAEKDLKRWLFLIRKDVGKLVYVAVWELQERGAIHWHLGVSGFQNVEAWRRAWYEVVGEGKGQPNVKDWSNRGGPAAVASYLGKYITKDQGSWVQGQRRFRASVGIRVPKEVHILGAVSMEGALARAQTVVRDAIGGAAKVVIKTGGGLYDWGFVGGYLS